MTPVVTVRRYSGRARIITAGLAVTLAVVGSIIPPSQTVEPSLIVSSSAFFAPSLLADEQIAPASILSSAAVYDPAVTAGEIAVTPPTIATAGAVYSPALMMVGQATVAPALILSTSAIAAPSVTAGQVVVAPASINSAAVVYAPAILPGSVSVQPTSIGSASGLFAPSIQPGRVSIQPALLASTAAIYAPAVAIIYDADAQAYFAAMTVQPSATRKSLISNLIAGHKADGDWAGLDRYALLAAHTAQAGLLDMRNPAKSASAQNGPAFTADRGFTGDGVTAYIDLGENPLAAGNQATLTNVTIGGWINQQSGTNGAMPLFGQFGTGVRLILIPNNIADETFRVGTISSGVFMATNGSRLGHRTMTRRDDTTQFGFFNGVLVSTDARVTTGAGSVFYVLRNNTSYSGDRVAAFYSGVGLTAAAVARIHARLNTFLTAIGAI